MHTLLDGVEGSGHYVGTYLAWGVNSSGWWGEGEIKFYLDGDDEFPTICGTGTEDYFGGAWNFDVPGQGYTAFSTPYLGLHQIIRPDGLYQSQQRFGMYRWHVLDPIRFSSDLRVNVQALGWRSAGGLALPAAAGRHRLDGVLLRPGDVVRRSTRSRPRHPRDPLSLAGRREREASGVPRAPQVSRSSLRGGSRRHRRARRAGPQQPPPASRVKDPSHLCGDPAAVGESLGPAVAQRSISGLSRVVVAAPVVERPVVDMADPSIELDDQAERLVADVEPLAAPADVAVPLPLTRRKSVRALDLPQVCELERCVRAFGYVGEDRGDLTAPPEPPPGRERFPKPYRCRTTALTRSGHQADDRVEPGLPRRREPARWPRPVCAAVAGGVSGGVEATDVVDPQARLLSHPTAGRDGDMDLRTRYGYPGKQSSGLPGKQSSGLPGKQSPEFGGRVVTDGRALTGVQQCRPHRGRAFGRASVGEEDARQHPTPPARVDLCSHLVLRHAGRIGLVPLHSSGLGRDLGDKRSRQWTGAPRDYGTDRSARAPNCQEGEASGVL